MPHSSSCSGKRPAITTRTWCRSRAGWICCRAHSCRSCAETGDHAILTVSFPVLRHLEVLKPFSRHKQRAIRQLHYDASAKVFVQFRRRFWEEDDGIIGGGTITDL